MYRAIDATHPVLGIRWVIPPHRVSCPTADQIAQVLFEEKQ